MVTLAYVNRLREILQIFFLRTGMAMLDSVMDPYDKNISAIAEALVKENDLKDTCDIDSLPPETFLGESSLTLLKELEAHLISIKGYKRQFSRMFARETIETCQL